jgi:hypothetical protein
MRAAPEQQMVSDIHCMIAAGQDLDWIDAQGATLVSRLVGQAGLGWGQMPKPRLSKAKLGQLLVGAKPLHSWIVCDLGSPHILWVQGCSWNMEG